ncbi:MAG: hypothetical protein AAGI03_01005 [Pseudomonadota bacterium]
MITTEQVQGHWARRWIKAPGFEDHSTRVHWAQVGSLYADVRIPSDRPALGSATSLAAMPSVALVEFCKAEGFAGTTSLSGDSCTWHREVNFHGAPDGEDVGQISFDENGDMIEAGVLSDYTELWAHSSAPHSTAFRLAGAGFEGILATVGETFVLAIDRPGRAATKPLIEALCSGGLSGIETLFDGIYAMGVWDGANATAKIATQPFSEGTSILAMKGNHAMWHRIDFAGERSSIPLAVEPGTP